MTRLRDGFDRISLALRWDRPLSWACEILLDASCRSGDAAGNDPSESEVRHDHRTFRRRVVTSWSSGSSAARWGPWIFSAFTWAIGLGYTEHLRTRVRRRRPSWQAWPAERAIRARVARAASDGRHPSTRWTLPPRTRNAATPCPPATTRSCSKGQSQPHGPDGSAGRRVCPADPRRARGVRNRRGVPYADYGVDLHEGQARFTQPLFDNLLATDWFPSVPPSTVASPAIRPRVSPT